MTPAQYYGPMGPFHHQHLHKPVYAANYPGGGFHFKNCPRAGNVALTQAGECDREQFRVTGTNQVFIIIPILVFPIHTKYEIISNSLIATSLAILQTTSLNTRWLKGNCMLVPSFKTFLQKLTGLQLGFFAMVMEGTLNMMWKDSISEYLKRLPLIRYFLLSSIMNNHSFILQSPWANGKLLIIENALDGFKWSNCIKML